MDDKRVADYFVIAGITNEPEFDLESRKLIKHELPITDITVIFTELGERCPEGYECISKTPGGHSADLNNGNFKSLNILVCFRRGDDKPPLTEVGVYHEDKDRLLDGTEVVKLTPYGRSASTGNSSSKSGTYITYRRARSKQPYNQLVVTDLCVILNNKSETPPQAYYPIKKNLNKSYFGMIGSEVFLCYKKSIMSPPSICYMPQIVSRFPLQDYANFPLPGSVPLFCLPVGATIELWPAKTPPSRPTPSTFVLTSDSAQKMYGYSLSFYEPYDSSNLDKEQKLKLGLTQEVVDSNLYKTFAIKSICILSRWPFARCFEQFLSFLHRLVFDPEHYSTSPCDTTQVPLEHHISHFMLDVSFPTPQRPTVVVQLLPSKDEQVILSQLSSRLPLPPTGASFLKLLTTLGVDNTMAVLLFGLSEQKILLHSLKPFLLTEVAEAITAALFPFRWQCPYVPVCPLSLHGILNAPLPFIVGIDSRCFDTFVQPSDIICINLDTRSIFMSEAKRHLNARILPKRAARVLKSSLEKIFLKWQRYSQAIGATQSPQHSLHPSAVSREQFEKHLELETQESFIRFMATILRGFRTYLLPITRAPTIGATDPTSLFNFKGFLMSRDGNYTQFYQLLTRTQMFTHYIEERSFVSDKDTSFAFFDDCEEKLTSSEDLFSDRPIKLFDKGEGQIQADRSVFIPAPEQSPSTSNLKNPSPICDTTETSDINIKFGPLNPALFHRHPQIRNPSIANLLSNGIEHNFLLENYSLETSNMLSIPRRTKQEVKVSQKLAKKCTETPLEWSKYLVSCCYCLWFAVLPSYIVYSKSGTTLDRSNSATDSKNILKVLRYAFHTLVRMQKMQLRTDEICFRVLTLLCGYYEQPALAVRVFCEMRKAGIKPNAVTYGLYNKAVLESKWPDHSQNPTAVLWSKIRNVITGVALFKFHGRERSRKRMRYMPMATDLMGFYAPGSDLIDRATQYAIAGDFLHEPTSAPGSDDDDDDDDDDAEYSGHDDPPHRPINRSFSTYPKSSDTIEDVIAEMSSPKSGSKLQKSYSLHLRDRSPERSSSLVKTKSINLDDEGADESIVVARQIRPSEKVYKPTTRPYDVYMKFKEKCQLVVGSGYSLTDNLTMIDHQSGILFSTDPNRIRASTDNAEADSLLDSFERKLNIVVPSNPSSFLRDSNLTAQDHLVSATNHLLKMDSLGEDAQILRNFGSTNESQKSKVQEVVESYCAENSSEDEEDCDYDDESNAMSNSTMDRSDSAPSQEDELGHLRGGLTSTPSAKISSFINDAGTLQQWSKWTSSQNSKSVYKGIKSAATGFVSSLQEIKSSFSISNSNTPAKLMNTAHNRSAATREMLSQWANFFSSQPSQTADGDDRSDEDSLASNDLLRHSKDEDVDPSTAEVSEFRSCCHLFETFERHYNNPTSKEDLMNHLSDAERVTDTSDVAIEIKLTTCSRCNVCNSLLYDEEIMGNWSHNESNLNTKCVYCRAKIVPLMSIVILDYRFGATSAATTNPEKDKAPTAVNETHDLVDLRSDSESAAEELATKQRADYAKSNTKTSMAAAGKVVEEVTHTVPYLSPIVLRKEIENVFETGTSGDSSLTSSQFVDEHPIIFWNLLWYFSRVNLPTHLAMLCLNSKSILNGKEIPADAMDSQGKVLVKTLWDNERLHTNIGKPLYRLLERGDPSFQVQSILCDELHFTYSSLERVINLIHANELAKAMSLILNARLKSSAKFSFDKNRHNLYRDLIFLIKMALGSNKLNTDNFECEYKKAFERLNFQQVALNRFDRPPTMRSLFCRKSFKELNLEGHP